MENSEPLLSVSDFIAVANQTLEYAFPVVSIEGEVASFKVNQGKYVFFDLKDSDGSVGCFMTVWQLRLPIEDGMKVIVTATPKLTQWGKFSLTVRAVRPSGEGNLKKSFEILKAKLEKEGLFATDRKRPLPTIPRHVAVISSTDAAGYADFMKIVGDRWGGLQFDVAHVRVQGQSAPDQIIRAIKYFNTQEELAEVIVIVRGGGSADDLSAFNDELLVREIAASRIPTLVGVGHEVDVSLADLAADVRAATPSNAAQILVPDRHDVIRRVKQSVVSLLPQIDARIDERRRTVGNAIAQALVTIDRSIEQVDQHLAHRRSVLAELNPYKVLERGYAIVRGAVTPGQMIEIEKKDILITAEVRHVDSK